MTDDAMSTAQLLALVAELRTMIAQSRETIASLQATVESLQQSHTVQTQAMLAQIAELQRQKNSSSWNSSKPPSSDAVGETGTEVTASAVEP